MVLELIEGPTMLAQLKRRPWTLARNAALLAQLHVRLHAIPGSVVHRDLHPENVMLAPSGAVVIDWTNAGTGDPALDVALVWVIGATSGGTLGRLFVRSFLRHFDRGEVLKALPAAADYRIADPNVTLEERDGVRRLVRLALEVR